MIIDAKEFIDEREIIVSAPAKHVFGVVTALGGESGWLYLDFLWKLRGWLDEIVGGVGMKPGRANPGVLKVGDIIDFWVVETVEPERYMRLRIKLILPGEGTLAYKIFPVSNDSSRLLQTVTFDAKGVFGHLYWFLLYPVHKIIFAGLIKTIAKNSE
ncbi:MAG: DUF2867 domain-containing protein [Chloroflexota bacterium]